MTQEELRRLSPGELVDLGICPTCFNRENGGVLYGDLSDKMVYEDGEIECFFVGNPRAEGHMCISTLAHYHDMSEAPDAVNEKMVRFAKRFMEILRQVYGCERVYLCTMCDGPNNHYHIQLIPRYAHEKRGSRNFVKPRTAYTFDPVKFEKVKRLIGERAEKKPVILVRGGGDLATGTVHRLWSAGFRVLVLETAHPAAIRRQVSVSEAVYQGSTRIEDMTARRIGIPGEAEAVWQQGDVPVLIDPACTCLEEIRPAVVVDAIMAKRNLGTSRDMAPRTIALGPGFTAGEDVDVVIETSRGHGLGRVIRQGSAKPNTGIPGLIGGYGKERVLHSPAAGILRNIRRIGDLVEQGEEIARVDTHNGSVPVKASISGIVRGLIRDGYPVAEGFKIADIDPRREELENCWRISDKARCIAGSVLEQVCAATGQ